MAKSGKKKIRRHVTRAIAHVRSTFNNTMITITDFNGETICWASSGTVGFKGTRKSTPLAAQRAGETVALAAKRHGVVEIEVRVRGPGSGRESALSGMQAAGLRIQSIEDVTPLPHNGCRPRRRRRV